MIKQSLFTRKEFSILLLLLCLIGIGMAVSFFNERFNTTINTSYNSSPKTAEAHWDERIRAVGGEAAYKEFAQSVQADSSNQRHQLSHYFGGALYNTLGTQGLSVCDSQFSFGCFHEFLGRAIADGGLSTVGALNQDCIDALENKSLSCQHGIGHGIAAFVGYTKADLDRELLTCKGLPHNDPIGGCYSGVFMEYNMRTMLGTSGSLRDVVNGDIFAPCDALASEYAKACAFWQPQWWQEKLYSGQDTPEVYAKLGASCDKMESNLVFRRSCYEGIGTITGGVVNNNPHDIAKLCEATSSDKLYQLYCKSYAANSLSQVIDQSQGVKVCAGLTGYELTYCNAYALNKANILQPITAPELQ